MVIRAACKDDGPAIAHVYAQTWKDTYLGIVPLDYLYTMSVDQLERSVINELEGKQTICLVAEAAEKVIGFISGGKERKGDYIYKGEIYALYVLKNYQRQGIGSKLVSVLAAELRRWDIYTMLVWVLKQNPYRRFYEKINGVYLQKKRKPFAGEILEIAAYGWIDTDLIHG